MISEKENPSPPDGGKNQQGFFPSLFLRIKL